jgi:hypothetical protein
MQVDVDAQALSMFEEQLRTELASTTVSAKVPARESYAYE